MTVSTSNCLMVVTNSTYKVFKSKLHLQTYLFKESLRV